MLQLGTPMQNPVWKMPLNPVAAATKAFVVCEASADGKVVRVALA
jgi:hypothetical protein